MKRPKTTQSNKAREKTLGFCAPLVPPPLPGCTFRKGDGGGDGGDDLEQLGGAAGDPAALPHHSEAGWGQ